MATQGTQEEEKQNKTKTKYTMWSPSSPLQSCDLYPICSPPWRNMSASGVTAVSCIGMGPESSWASTYQ
jgi:hypothetical protein